MINTTMITEKINGVREEMKTAGIWSNQLPEWVHEFEKRNIYTQNDFSEWLQFVYLPNLSEQSEKAVVCKTNIVPQALKFFGEDVKRGQLLRLLIELDSLA